MSAHYQKTVPPLASNMAVQQPPEVTLLIAAVDRNPDRRAAWFNATVEDLMHQDITLAKLEVLLLSLVPLDKEPEFVQHAVSSVPGTFKHIFFRTDPGVYNMWNRGWSMALGEFVTTLNMDDRLAHTALREKASFLRQHEACDVVSCVVVASPQVVSFEESKSRYMDTAAGKWKNESQWKSPSHWFKFRWLQVISPSLFLRPKSPDNPPHNSPFWRKSLVNKVGQGGMFRPEFDPLSDMELWARSAVQGAAICHMQTPLQTYFYNRSYASHNRRDPAKQVETKSRMMREWQPFVANRILWLGDAWVVNSGDTGHSFVIQHLQRDHRLVAVQAHTDAPLPPSAPPPAPPPPPPPSQPPPPPCRTITTRTRGHVLEDNNTITIPCRSRRRPSLPPKPAEFRLFQKTFYHDATHVPDQSIPRTAARLAYNADLIVVAPSPHWRCNDVRRALAVALHVRTSADAAQIVLLLPSHDAEVDEHTCAGQAGAELSQHVDLLLSWTHQRTLESLRAAPSGLLKPHACLRSLSGDNESHPSADFLARSRTDQFASLPTSMALQAAYYALRTGQCTSAPAASRPRRDTRKIPDELCNNTAHECSTFCLQPGEASACAQAAQEAMWCTHGVRDRCPTPSAPKPVAKRTAAAVVAEFRVTRPSERGRIRSTLIKG